MPPGCRSSSTPAPTPCWSGLRHRIERKEGRWLATPLCVGINEFKSLPRSSWLSGCVNDADDLAKALRKLGFSARDTARAHRQGRHQAEGAGRPDRAGRQGEAGGPPGLHLLQPRHAGAEPAGDDDEPDGLDEAFACYDIKQSGDDWDRKTVIVDDELRDAVREGARGRAGRGAARHLPQRHRAPRPRRHPAGDGAGPPPALPAAAHARRASAAPARSARRRRAPWTARRWSS